MNLPLLRSKACKCGSCFRVGLQNKKVLADQQVSMEEEPEMEEGTHELHLGTQIQPCLQLYNSGIFSATVFNIPLSLLLFIIIIIVFWCVCVCGGMGHAIASILK